MPDHKVAPDTEVSSVPAQTSRQTDLPRFHGDRPRSKRRWWPIVLAIVLVGGGIWFLIRRHQAAEEAAKAKAAVPRAIPVETTSARTGDIGVYVEALGTVTPIYTVMVTSRVQGQITKIYYREGQMVKKGDPLLDIDDRPYHAALTQAQGQLAHDEGVLSQAKIDQNRYQEAFNRNAIAKQQLDDQIQAVAQDEGTVKSDQGTVENAEINLQYCHITAPIDGRVGLRLVDPGNVVQANSTTTLVVITQLQPISVIFSIGEDYLPEIEQQLRQGHTMSVDALDRAQAKELAKGSLLTLDNEVDTTTGTVKLKALFANGGNTLFPDQFVNARLLVDTQHGVVLVPTPAIQRNSQNAFVYVIKPDQTASMRTVTVGVTEGNNTGVQGVQSGEVIAVNGFDKLQDGVKVAPTTGGQNGSGQSSGQNSSSGDQAP